MNISNSTMRIIFLLALLGSVAKAQNVAIESGSEFLGTSWIIKYATLCDRCGLHIELNDHVVVSITEYGQISLEGNPIEYHSGSLLATLKCALFEKEYGCGYRWDGNHLDVYSEQYFVSCLLIRFENE